MTKQERIFKIAHRLAKTYRVYNYNLTYRECFAQELRKQYKFEAEAEAAGTLEARIEMQITLCAPAKTEAQLNMTFTEVLAASQNKLKVASQKSEISIAA